MVSAPAGGHQGAQQSPDCPRSHSGALLSCQNLPAAPSADDTPICRRSTSLCLTACLQDATSLPFLTAPHDALREGLVTLKDGATSSHPVDQIQKLSGPTGEKAQVDMLRNVYGAALPARMQIERQILNRQAGGGWAAGGGRAGQPAPLQLSAPAGRRPGAAYPC